MVNLYLLLCKSLSNLSRKIKEHYDRLGECKYKSKKCPWAPLPNGLCDSRIDVLTYKPEGRPPRCYKKMAEREPELEEQEKRRSAYRRKLYFKRFLNNLFPERIREDLSSLMGED